jgi:DNA replication licensing factor MCM2
MAAPDGVVWRGVAQEHLDTLVRVVGVVTRRTQVFPQLQMVTFDCVGCGQVMGPYRQTEGADLRPASCTGCGRAGPFRINQVGGRRRVSTGGAQGS